jgi:hypothetical protein
MKVLSQNNDLWKHNKITSIKKKIIIKNYNKKKNPQNKKQMKKRSNFDNNKARKQRHKWTCMMHQAW